MKVYGEDSHSRTLWLSPAATAREVCHLLVQTAHCSDQENWALLELHPTLGLGTSELRDETQSCESDTLTLCLSPQRDAWRTTRLCWRFRPPGLSSVTQDSCSARTTPNTSSSGSRWYASFRLIPPFLSQQLQHLVNKLVELRLTRAGMVWFQVLGDWQVACWFRHAHMSVVTAVTPR